MEILEHTRTKQGYQVLTEKPERKSEKQKKRGWLKIHLKIYNIFSPYVLKYYTHLWITHCALNLFNFLRSYDFRFVDSMS